LTSSLDFADFSIASYFVIASIMPLSKWILRSFCITFRKKEPFILSIYMKDLSMGRER